MTVQPFGIEQGKKEATWKEFVSPKLCVTKAANHAGPSLCHFCRTVGRSCTSTSWKVAHTSSRGGAQHPDRQEG